jgi:hypothetical protein
MREQGESSTSWMRHYRILAAGATKAARNETVTLARHNARAMKTPRLPHDAELRQSASHAREAPVADNEAALAWMIEAWDDEEILYDGEWDDLLRSGK